MAQHDKAPARAFERFASAATRFTGSVPAFAMALGIIVVWAVTGPLFHFSDTWQLVINTGTTIVTFLMVFLIQQTQNKDGLAIQLKLNELVAALEGASNRLISVEDLTGEELRVLHAHYQLLAKKAAESCELLELERDTVASLAATRPRVREVLESFCNARVGAGS